MMNGPVHISRRLRQQNDKNIPRWYLPNGEMSENVEVQSLISIIGNMVAQIIESEERARNC